MGQLQGLDLSTIDFQTVKIWVPPSGPVGLVGPPGLDLFNLSTALQNFGWNVFQKFTDQMSVPHF